MNALGTTGRDTELSPWRDDGLVRPRRKPSGTVARPRVEVWLITLAVGTAIFLGGLLLVSPQMAFVAVAASGVVAITCAYPAAAAFILIGATPLIAGIDRGLLIPLLRPNEALAVLVAVGLVLRYVPRVAVNGIPQVRVRPIDVTIIVMAVASSILPLLWLAVRGQSATHDDYLYALIIWKYYGLFLIIRASVRTERQVRTALAIGLASASIVAVIAILQSLKLFGVPGMLATYYTHFGNVRALNISRGSSTLSLPVAVADLMILNIAVVYGWLRRTRRHRLLLSGTLVLLVFGTLASGQFSGAIALVLCAAAIVFLAQDVRPVVTAAPIVLVAGVALRSVVQNRLNGFASPQGLPVSWVGRLQHLRTYFFPELFSRLHWVLGVRPAARVLLSERLGYVWIESGYTWLLWAGGIPLLLSFCAFIWVNLRTMGQLARRRLDAIGMAATGCYVGLIVIAVLMMFDPHLTYRGSADMLFALLGLASAGTHIPALAPKGQSDHTAVGTAA